MPKVSVIIPVYNAKDYLERCLDSVCNQTLKDIEILAVDDCSTDNSLEILQKYALKYPNLKIFHLDKNSGESVARNIGIGNATGEYLGFVDNDDEIDLDFYEKLYNKAKEDCADIAKGEVRQFGIDGKEEFPPFKINENIHLTKNKMYFLIHWWTAIYKRKIILDNGIKLPEDIILGGDAIFLNLAVLASNKVSVVDDTFYYYYCRRQNGGDSYKLSIEKVKSLLKTYEIILQSITNSKDEAIDKDVYNYIYKIYGRGFFDVTMRNNSKECLKLCSEYAIRNYKNCKYKIDFKKFLLAEYPYLTEKMLIEGDEKALFVAFRNNDNPQKILFSKLRKGFIKRAKNEAR